MLLDCDEDQLGRNYMLLECDEDQLGRDEDQGSIRKVGGNEF